MIFKNQNDGLDVQPITEFSQSHENLSHIQRQGMAELGLDLQTAFVNNIKSYPKHRFFDYLLLKGTNLPPIIEGCNARELCETFGRAFIHGSSKLDKFRQYKVNLENMQKLHTEASLCLQLGDHQYYPALLEYLERSLLKRRTWFWD